MTSAFAGGIQFLGKLGVYDVVLPFLLVFTLVYAFLEKTKVFGTETYYSDGDEEHKGGWKGTRRNLNSMAAFVSAFFVIASSQLVAIINQALAHTVLILLLVFCFMLVAGSFHEQTDKGFFLSGGWKTTFMVIAFVAITFIFLNALGWLPAIWGFITNVWSSEAVASLILIAIIVGFIFWVTSDPRSGSGKKEEESA